MSSHRSQRLRLALLTLPLVALASTLVGAEQGETLRDDFEAPRTAWRREEADATIRLLAHDRSNRAAHDGQRSEHFQFEAGPGSGFYFSYALPKIPVTNDLAVGLYVRSNHAGVQLKGRVILPADKDPDTGEPSFVLVQGPLYENTERWQRLELVDIRREAEGQVRILRASTRRPITLDGAYLDRLVINLYGGPGLSDVFVDDLTVTPVTRPPAPATVGPPVPEPVPPGPEAVRPEAPARNDLPVQLVNNRLSRQGRPWVPTAIYAPGADVPRLRRAGFDLFADDLHASPKRIEQAIASGMMLMPMIGGAKPGDVADPAEVARTVENYPYREAVAFWHLGQGLGRVPTLEARKQELTRVRSAVAAVHELRGPFSRLTTAEVDGDPVLLAKPPKNLDALGVRPICWGSSQQPFETYSYFGQRRTLAVRTNSDELFWTWIPTAPPASLAPLIWGTGNVPDYGEPRVQPEQIRLYTYLALAAGYRGIGYLGDANLTGDQGQMELIELELLNEEIDLFESIIASGTDPYPLYNTFMPDPPILPPSGSRTGQRVAPTPELSPHASIRASAINTLDRKGMLLLVYDLSGASQFQPPQMAEQELWLTVIAPEGAQAFEFSPGGMRVLETKRGFGGRRIKLDNFGVSSLILMTTDLDLGQRLEAQINQNRSIAVQLAIRQAQLQYEWVTSINDKLVGMNHGYKEGPEMLAAAAKTIEDARAFLEREDYLNAWTEARRAGRSLRLLMRIHWDRAMEAVTKATDFGEKAPKDDPATKKASGAAKKKTKAPKIAQPRIMATGCAPCVAFNTLPQHYRLLEWLEDKWFSDNLLASGSFDDLPALQQDRWDPETYEYEGVSGKIDVTSKTAYHDKGRALHLSVVPTDKDAGVDGLPIFFDFPPIAIRSPAIPVTAEYLYRISVLVKAPLNSVSGIGGVIVRDSIGGEALQYRTNEKITDWARVVMYRRAPEDGTLTVTLGLAAYGEAFFDDFRVEQVQDHPSRISPDVAERRRRQSTEPAPSSATRPVTPDRRSR